LKFFDKIGLNVLRFIQVLVYDVYVILIVIDIALEVQLCKILLM